MFDNYQPVRGGGRYARDHKKDDADFRLKVDIPYFDANLNIEDFIDWIADVDKFFEYMKSQKRRGLD